MKTTDYIANKLNKLASGYVFTYNDFITEVNKKEAVVKALNRMVQSGRIAKLSKGRYYKPESTPFGQLQPVQFQIAKDLLEVNGVIKGYLTGFSIYNRLGLTSQLSNLIQIGRNEIRPSLTRERYSISFVKQKNKITKENIPLLQILDAIRYINKIPDATIENSCNRILIILEDLSNVDKIKMLKLAMKYPPSARAILGAMYNQIDLSIDTELLFQSLNPITKYKISGVKNILPIAEKWNIV